MKSLSERQARNCEEAIGKVCRCRCGGALHGAKRSGGGSSTPRSFFEELPKEDPHYLPPKKGKPIQLVLPIFTEVK